MSLQPTHLSGGDWSTMRHSLVDCDANCLKFAFEVAQGRNQLRISCPPGKAALWSEQIGGLMLFLDESVLCPPGQEAEKVSAKSRVCSRLFDLVVVPLANDLSPDEAKKIGRDAAVRFLEFHKLEIERARILELGGDFNGRRKVRNERHVRVYAPARANGSVSIPAAA